MHFALHQQTIHPILLSALLLAVSAASARASELTDYVRRCEVKLEDASTSAAFRICAYQYLDRIEADQARLLASIRAKFKADQDSGIEAESATDRLNESQTHWKAFVKAHCDAAEFAFGRGNSQADVMPSCLVSQTLSRNRQLRAILRDGNFER